MLYTDLIEAGALAWGSELPYGPGYYEAGEGDITNSEKRAYYPIEELVYQMLTYSDNTATNILALYYMDNYGDYWGAVKRISGLEITDPALLSGNDSTADILAHTLMRLAEDESYEKIVTIMNEAQTDFRLKKYLTGTMAAKYGSYEDFEHDAGVYFDGEQPQYVLVIMTQGVSNVDEFMGQLSLQIYEWHESQSN